MKPPETRPYSINELADEIIRTILATAPRRKDRLRIFNRLIDILQPARLSEQVILRHKGDTRDFESQIQALAKLFRTRCLETAKKTHGEDSVERAELYQKVKNDIIHELMMRRSRLLILDTTVKIHVALALISDVAVGTITYLLLKKIPESRRKELEQEILTAQQRATQQ